MIVTHFQVSNFKINELQKDDLRFVKFSVRVKLFLNFDNPSVVIWLIKLAGGCACGIGSVSCRCNA